VPETPPLEGGYLLRARNDFLKTGDKVEKVGLEKEGDEGGRGRDGERRREKERIYNIQLYSICIVVNY
jgi:hypothetical protein